MRTTPVIDSAGHSPHSARDRTPNLLGHRTLGISQGYPANSSFHSVTALSVDEGWTRINFFDISAVEIDHEFADDRCGKDRGLGPATAESEPECVCRTLGQAGKRRVPVEADSVWRALTQTDSTSLRE